METNALEEKRRFVRDVARGQWTMSALCDRYGITRQCGHKWWDRYCAEGAAGLVERSRAPHHCPYRTDARLEARIVALRRQRGWGAKKLRQILQQRHPADAWPARSTFNDILDRAGLLEKRRRYLRWPHSGSVRLTSERPNQVWPADFKGQFKLGSGAYCYPLTITDHFSRRILAVQAMSAIRAAAVRAVFLRLFREVGLPDAIRTDNGAPFASSGLHGLSVLGVWWMQLGITHQRIRPGRPQDNGSHERMHRELKRETARPAAAHAHAQQRRFRQFQRRYNEERPHEGIDNQTPASRWHASQRAYPERLPPPDYPTHWEVRRASNAGVIRFHDQRIFLTQALHHENVGLEEIDDGLWRVVYYQTPLGLLDERTGRVTGLGTNV